MGGEREDSRERRTEMLPSGSWKNLWQQLREKADEGGERENRCCVCTVTVGLLASHFPLYQSLPPSLPPSHIPLFPPPPHPPPTTTNPKRLPSRKKPLTTHTQCVRVHVAAMCHALFPPPSPHFIILSLFPSHSFYLLRFLSPSPNTQTPPPSFSPLTHISSPSLSLSTKKDR